MPTDASFYVAGTAAADASQVNVMIVRTGSPWIWSAIRGAPGTPCEVVAARLQPRPEDPIVLPTLSARMTNADQVWRGAPADWKVRVGAPADVTTAKAWQILFEKDTDFFSAGHRYCVFVYQSSIQTRTDPALAELMLAAVEHYTDCMYDGDDAHCRIDRRGTDALIAHVDEDRRDAVRARRDASPGLAKEVNDGKRAVNILRNWEARAAVVQPSLGVPPALRTALVGYLIDAGKLPAPAAATATVTLARDPAGGLVVKADAVSVNVSDPAFGATPMLRDLIELSLGRLPLQNGYTAITDYAETLAPITAKLDKPLSPAESAVLTSAVTSLDRIAGEVENVHVERDNAAASKPGDARKAELGTWLATVVERPCDVAVQRLWRVLVTSCTAGLAGWSTYADLDGNPLAKLANLVRHFQSGQPAWLAERPVIADTVVVTRLFARPFGATVEMTQNAWFFSYCSPVIGYAMSAPDRPGRDESISLRYYGLQIHARPNPAHKPELDAGVVALELGFAATGSFGPDNRFRGWSGLAPLFVGGAIHLIPYTSLSIGMMAADRRSTTLPQEGYHHFYDLYIGLSVDANVPDLVRSLTGNASSTSAVPAKGGTP